MTEERADVAVRNAEIVRRYSDGGVRMRELATEYGISAGRVQRIIAAAREGQALADHLARNPILAMLQSRTYYRLRLRLLHNRYARLSDRQLIRFACDPVKRAQIRAVLATDPEGEAVLARIRGCRMTEERAVYATPEPERALPHLREGSCTACRRDDELEHRMWLMIRRGLLLVVRGIEVKHGNESHKDQVRRD